MATFHWFSLFLILSTTIFVNAGRSKRSPILTDDLAKPNQFRWAVGIAKNRIEYVCSGGIIAEKFILSAAHCFMDSEKKLAADRFTVYPGTIDVKVAAMHPFTVKRSVRRIFVPKNFGSRFFQADIAVLELVKDLETRRHNLPILTLPFPFKMIAYGERAHVAAFGACDIATDGNKKLLELDGKLRYAKIRLVDRLECHGVPDGKIGIYNLLGQIEKNSTKKFGMCYGDSGASLVQSSGRVIGVFIGSLDGSCDERTKPAVYSSVRYYVPFIREAMSGKHTEDMHVAVCQPN